MSASPRTPDVPVAPSAPGLTASGPALLEAQLFGPRTRTLSGFAAEVRQAASPEAVWAAVAALASAYRAYRKKPDAGGEVRLPASVWRLIAHGTPHLDPAMAKWVAWETPDALAVAWYHPARTPAGEAALAQVFAEFIRTPLGFPAMGQPVLGNLLRQLALVGTLPVQAPALHRAMDVPWLTAAQAAQKPYQAWVRMAVSLRVRLPGTTADDLIAGLANARALGESLLLEVLAHPRAGLDVAVALLRHTASERILLAMLRHPSYGRSKRLRRELARFMAGPAVTWAVLEHFLDGTDPWTTREALAKAVQQYTSQLMAALLPGSVSPVLRGLRQTADVLLRSPDAALRERVILALGQPAPEPPKRRRVR